MGAFHMSDIISRCFLEAALRTNYKRWQHVREITTNDDHFYCMNTAQNIKPCVCVCVIGPSAQQSDTSLPTQVMAHFPRMNDDHHLMRILHFIALDLPVTEQPPARLHTDESADPLLN